MIELNGKSFRAFVNDATGKVVLRVVGYDNKERVFGLKPVGDKTKFFTPFQVSDSIEKLNLEPLAGRTARRHTKALIEGKALSELK